MCLLSDYAESFCEIKSVKSSRTVCTGYIESVSENSMALSSVVFYTGDTSFDANIIILSNVRELQVLKAKIINIDDTHTVFFEDLGQVTDTERRAAFRAVVDLPVLVTLDDKPSVGYDGFIKDMSIRGLSLWVHERFVQGDKLRLQFPLGSQSHMINCQCVVVRAIGSNSYSMKKYGCDFVQMSKEDASALQTYMTRKRTEYMQRTLLT